MDTSDKIKEYLEAVSCNGGINEVRFITLLPLTNECNTLKVDVSNIITTLKEYTNAGCLYDKNICECFSFMYVSSQGIPVTTFIRNTKEAKSHYLRQLLFDAQNNLLTGFGGEVII